MLALTVPAIALGAVAAAGGPSASAATKSVAQVRAISASTTAAVLTGATSRIAATQHAASTAHRRKGVTTKRIAWLMMHRFGWRARFQFRYLNLLWMRESSWNVHASNPYSGAYGIPQAVPGSKMSTAGRNWENSATTQIRWGMRYIRGRYGSPRSAWAHESAYGWY